MADSHIRNTLMGLFIAGHETTAVMMTWILYLLSRYTRRCRSRWKAS